MFDVNEAGEATYALRKEADDSLAILVKACTELVKTPVLLRRLQAIDDPEALRRAQNLAECLGNLSTALDEALAPSGAVHTERVYTEADHAYFDSLGHVPED